MSPANARAQSAEPDMGESAPFSVDRWSATSGNGRPSRANLTVRGAGHLWRAHSAGNGGVDALLRAVDLALAPFLGEGVELASFTVHAVGAGHDARASVSLSIRPRSEGGHAPAYPGQGADENVLEATIVAYLDAINRYLAHAGVDTAAVAAEARPRRSRTSTVDGESRVRRLSPLMELYNP
jgi:2-isopropylmalate synthase